MMTAAAATVSLACLLTCAGVLAQIEAPPAPSQTRPAPADGETLSANPPAFLWIPAKPAEQYLLEYSRDAEFPPAATTQARTPWLIHVPCKALAPGRWYWRWRPAGGESEPAATSPVRSFVVPEGATKLPFPDVAAVVRRLGASRPRVLVTARQLPRVRAWAAQTQAKWIEQTRRDAERALADELLREPEFPPPPGDPKRGPIYVRIFRTTRPVYARMARLAEGYLLSGDETMGRAAKRLLMNFVSWDPEGSTSLGHNDEPATEFVRVCPRVYDWVYPILTDEERARCRAVFETRMKQLYSRWSKRPFERFPYESHNMGYYLPDLTEACIAMAGELDVEEMLRYCLMQLWSPYYPPYGGDDGGWQEGPGYWRWIMMVVSRLYYMVEQATGVRIAGRSSVRNAASFKLYANPPHAKMSPFGDGQAGPAGGGMTMYQLAALYHDPYALWYAREQNARPSGLAALMWDVSDLEPRAPIDLPQSKCFFSTGEACLHTALWSARDDVQFLFRSCPFGAISHAYADQNTFTLDAFGEPLIIASGYYPYYASPHHAQWTWTTAASNSILVNGKGQATRNWNSKGEIVRLAASANADYVVGDAKRAYPGVLTKYLRRVLFVRPLQTGGPTVIAVHDELAAGQPSSFQWLLHALEEMKVDAEAQRVWIERGDSRCRVDFLLPEKLNFTQTDQFTVPPETGNANQWHLTASAEEKADARGSLIVMIPCRASETKGLPEVRRLEGEGCVAALIAGRGAEHLILFNTGGGTANVPEVGLVTDAEAAAVTRRNGRVTGFFAAGGTRLELGGSSLMDSSGTADVGAVTFPGEQLISLKTAEPAECRIACPRKPRAVRQLDGSLLDSAYDAQAGLLKLTLPAGETTASALFEPARGHESTEPPELRVSGHKAVPMTRETFPLVRRARYSAACPDAGGHHEITLRARADGDAPCPIVLSVGRSEARWSPPPGGAWQELTVPVTDLPPDGLVTLTVDGSLGGECEIASVTARRVYGRNLAPNSGFEEADADGTVALWRPGRITNDAQCAIESSSPGRTGERCLKITCTKAGGDFAAYLSWPGVSPVSYDRRFRVGVWVRNGPDSNVGIQVTDRVWRFHQTTQRISDCAEWREAALSFTLPAGNDLTHLRLHMRADREGAVMYADDVSLVELPPSARD